MTSNNPVFDAYSRYYDLLYRDKDYAHEIAYIDALLQRHELIGPDLLEFSSGTGRHGRLLAERGYRVTGIERSAAMVAQATAVPGFVCREGDICAVQLGRTFAAVLPLFHVVSYQVTNAAVQAVFARAAEHLAPGGLFAFDVWYSPAVYTQGPKVRIKRMAGEGVEITRLAEPLCLPNDNRVDVNYSLFVRDTLSGRVETLAETHPMRHFSLPELDLVGETAGFERLGTEEFLTGAAPSEAIWGLCVVLRKRLIKAVPAARMGRCV
ncbi:MAG: class I SAM-dependent methyltransferase [Chromatiaceae bacterium]